MALSLSSLSLVLKAPSCSTLNLVILVSSNLKPLIEERSLALGVTEIVLLDPSVLSPREMEHPNFGGERANSFDSIFLSYISL